MKASKRRVVIDIITVPHHWCTTLFIFIKYSVSFSDLFVVVPLLRVYFFVAPAFFFFVFSSGKRIAFALCLSKKDAKFTISKWLTEEVWFETSSKRRNTFFSRIHWFFSLLVDADQKKNQFCWKWNAKHSLSELDSNEERTWDLYQVNCCSTKIRFHCKRKPM